MRVFLLVNGASEDHWFDTLQNALSPLGQLEAVSEGKAVSHALRRNFDIVIVDASTVSRVELLISRLHVQNPQVRVVVVTASPEWKLARAAFVAGAVDYVFKSLDKQELLTTFMGVLARPRKPSGDNSH